MDFKRIVAASAAFLSVAVSGHGGSFNSLRSMRGVTAYKGNATALLESSAETERRIFEEKMRYMPGHNLVVCACAKCGSSSLYEFIYEKEFGTHWPYRGAPFPQTTDSERWEGRFLKVEDDEEQRKIMKKAFSFALVRDPVDRLISAWKSKVACDSNRTGVDKADRARMVPALLKLIGDTRKDVKCLSFDDFAQALYTAHKAGRAGELNVHWIPQDRACFGKFPANEWSKVVAIQQADSFSELALWLSDGKEEPKAVDETPPKMHSSSWNKAVSQLTISPHTASILAIVTANEYHMLGQHLPSM